MRCARGGAAHPATRSAGASRGLGAATPSPRGDDLLTKEQLAAEVKAGKIDTVVVAFTDMQGRLMGKRVDGEYFVESAAHGEPTEGCNYLLTVDMDMDPVPGYEMASWERGYGDFDLVPDFATLRRIPWLERSEEHTSELQSRQYLVC